MVLVGLAVKHLEALPVPADTIVIHGEEDSTVPLADVLAWARPQDLPVVVVPGADHFFHRRLHMLRAIVQERLEMNSLQVSGLRKSFGAQEVVSGVDLEVAPGECFGLLGPNGAGKTTTLRLCLGLSDPDAGEIRLLGHAGAGARARGARAGRRGAAVRQPRPGFQRRREPRRLRPLLRPERPRRSRRASRSCWNSPGSRAAPTPRSRRFRAA